MAERDFVSTSLRWDGGLRFDVGGGTMTLDGDGKAGASPVLALVASLAGCMAADVVHILVKARLPLEGLTVAVQAERAPSDPRRLLRAALRFEVRGEVPDERVEHAIRLSRETYCSVWHSLARDIQLTTEVSR
jgi:putative redox protein